MSEDVDWRQGPDFYRAALSCRCGRDVLDGLEDPPEGFTRSDWALRHALHAVEDLALGLLRLAESINRDRKGGEG